MTLLDDLEEVAVDADRRGAHGYAKRFREHARRLREEVRAITDNRQESSRMAVEILRVIVRINGGPVSREPG